MKLKIKNSLFFILFISTISFGQMNEFDFKQEIREVNDQWHKITLPPNIFKYIKNDVSDVRIFGIKSNNDTIEAPYILRQEKQKTTRSEVQFKKLNESYTNENYYFTFQVPVNKTINQIDLKFLQDNFDWKVKLEASMDNLEWFTLVEDYRILSIKNTQTNFQFTKLIFPDSKYLYYRLSIPSKKKPKITSTSLNLQSKKDANYYNYNVKSIQTKQNKKNKETILEVTLNQPLSVSYLNIKVLDSFDYYRPITIKYLKDSVNTEKGLKFNYQTITSNTLNSIEKNDFIFSSTTAQKLKIIISNYDNEPLHIDQINVKGSVHELVARFSENATYYLTYGNKNATKPKYDLNRFAEKIPNDLKNIKLMEPQEIDKIDEEKGTPLFMNKNWLWGIMTLIILVLGWYSLKMIRKV